MLLNVHVKNLALIEDADIYFGDGLNILTGETGAGKSILMGAVSLALGDKSKKGMIRSGAEYGLAELIFCISDEEKAALCELGIEPDDENKVIISRRIMDGRSVLKVNGNSCTAAVLKEACGYLINIHGQHETTELIKRKQHINILDTYGSEIIFPLLSKAKSLYNKYKELNEKLHKFDMDDTIRKREISLCEYQLDEISRAALKIGEDEEIESRAKFFNNAGKISDAISNAYSLVFGDGAKEGALDNLGMASKLVSDVCAYDENISSLLDVVSSAESLCRDAASELERYRASFNYDQGDADYVASRLDLINTLKNKYGRTIEDIFSYAKETEKRLESLNNYDEELSLINKKIEETKKEYKDTCKKLTNARKQAASEFEKNLVAALKDLNFNDVRFFVKIDTDDEKITTYGSDEVEFYISVNVGEDIKPLVDVASGGELSRIMLGIKSIMAGKDDIETLIFDEIDSGISGITAAKVGEKLKALSKNHQIICITHLPQIAAKADTHFLIEKKVINDKSVTEINEIKGDGIINEIARMLGGDNITDSILQGAREMKNSL